MRQVTHMHRTLTVLAVGLLALAAPLVAYADGGRPSVTESRTLSNQRPRSPAGLRAFTSRAERRPSELPACRSATMFPFSLEHADRLVGAHRWSLRYGPRRGQTAASVVSDRPLRFAASVRPASATALSASLSASSESL